MYNSELPHLILAILLLAGVAFVEHANAGVSEETVGVARNIVYILAGGSLASKGMDLFTKHKNGKDAMEMNTKRLIS
jgi:hypothetical protein